MDIHRRKRLCTAGIRPWKGRACARYFAFLFADRGVGQCDILETRRDTLRRKLTYQAWFFSVTVEAINHEAQHNNNGLAGPGPERRQEDIDSGTSKRCVATGDRTRVSGFSLLRHNR